MNELHEMMGGRQKPPPQMVAGEESKAQVIARILENPVYMPESGMCSQVRSKLERLPLVTLNQLLIIVECK